MTAVNDLIYVENDLQLTQLQGVLNFDKELVAAKMKVLTASHALTRIEGTFLASIDDILPEPDFNLRLSGEDLDTHIREIADSMKREGFRQHEPITVFGSIRGKKPVFVITDGYCRHAGAMLARSEGAELEYLPIMVKPAETTNEDLIFDMILTGSSSKRRLKPYEIAIGCKRLRAFNVSYENIAKRLGYSAEYVHQLLELAGAPYAIRSMVEKNQMTAALAISTMRTHGHEAESVLTSAFQAATVEGKTRLTAKSLPNQLRKNALKNSAVKMFDALQKVRAYKQYNKLPSQTRDLIEELFKTLGKYDDGEVEGEGAAQDSGETLLAN